VSCWFYQLNFIVSYSVVTINRLLIVSYELAGMWHVTEECTHGYRFSSFSEQEA